MKNAAGSIYAQRLTPDLMIDWGGEYREMTAREYAAHMDYLVALSQPGPRDLTRWDYWRADHWSPDYVGRIIVERSSLVVPMRGGRVVRNHERELTDYGLLYLQQRKAS